MFRFLEHYPLLFGLCSFAILILGLFHFEQTVTQKRFLTIQISQYQPGDQVKYMRATISGRTAKKKLVLEDIVGAKIVTDLKDNSFRLGALVVLKGKLDENRLFKVDTIEAYPSITMKFISSFLVVIVFSWKLLGRVKISPQGLILPPPTHLV
tara:strand:+ start:360 stop:818 length:459 start_codon:yes stop_codon:yes gene_type:complete